MWGYRATAECVNITSDSITADLQTLFSINISTEAVCQELHDMDFGGQAALVGVRYTTFVHIVHLVDIPSLYTAVQKHKHA